MDLVMAIYNIVGKLPLHELYGLTSQIRAAVSLPANIAEGFRRWHVIEFTHFLPVANGSVKELETHLLIGSRIGYFQPRDIEPSMQMTKGISKMIFSLRDKLSR
jgi:four helix bundle protein